MIVGSLTGYIADHIPHFKALPNRDQQAIAAMAWQWAAGNAHDRDSTSTPFTKNFLRTLWGSDERARSVLGNRYFHVHAPGAVADGIASAWRPRKSLQAAIMACLDETQSCDLLDIGDAGASRWPVALPSRRGRANSSFAGLTCANAVPVDMNALSACASIGSPVDQRFAKSLLRMANNTVRPGHVPMRYDEASTGRLFAKMGILQGHSRRTRSAALAGRWDYDISNCHFAALLHLGRGAGVRLPVTEMYLAQKKAIRAQLASDCGSTEDGVKQALLGMVYGMRLTAWKKGSLAHSLGHQDAAKQFVKADFVQALRAELKDVTDVLIVKNTIPGGRVRNALGRAASSRDSRGQLLSHILQGLEAAALRAVIRRYGEHVLLAVHDGWVMDQFVDPADLQATVQAETGCPFSIECSRLQVQAEQRPEDKNTLMNQEDANSTRHPHANIGVQPQVWVDPFQPPVGTGQSAQSPRRSGLVLSNAMSWSADDGVIGVRWAGASRNRRTAHVAPTADSLEGSATMCPAESAQCSE